MLKTPMLYFIRHAESRANKARVLASQTDVPLTDSGREAAAQIAEEFLAEYKPDTIFCSPQLRARQTCAPFSDRTGLSVIIDAALAEQHMGRFTGVGYDEAYADPGYEMDKTKRWQWVPEGGGESYEMMAERIRPFFDRPEVRDSSRHVLIVTHAITLRIINGLLKQTLPAYPHDIANNGEIWEVDFRGLNQIHVIKSHYYGNSRQMVHNA